MRLVILILGCFLLASENVAVDSNGKVRVPPEEREREARGLSLLRNAEDYYASQSRDSSVAIAKYETVLREVDLHSKLREEILFKVAGLCEENGEYLLAGVSPGNGARANLGVCSLNQALTYYGAILSFGLDETRPVLLADTLLRMGDIYGQLGKTRDALPLFLRARAVARDQSFPSERPGIDGRRTSMEQAALAKMVSLLEGPINRRLRDRLIRENAGDSELTRALVELADARKSIRSPPPALGRRQQGLALFFGFFTVGLILVMRRRLQYGPR